MRFSNDTPEVFRARLRQVIDRSKLSITAFAKKVGIDRSTLSQILSDRTWRLPRVETLTAIAAAEKVSIDWLVGLSQEGGLGADILPVTVEISKDSSSPTDDQLNAWRSEALGYKIRYVPSTLPDLLKLDAVIEYEYRHSVLSPEQRLAATEARLAYQRRPETDMEIVSSVQALTGFARGEGMWADLDPTVRDDQLQYCMELVDELYPTLRWFLFDRLERYSVPLTVFGPKRAVIYLGQRYLVLNSREIIEGLTRHFDALIRSAVVEPTAITAFLRTCREDVE